tara:strand:- start:45 stop:440 length:396 start_codon:yes stop_codon:yes gene_type:complete
MKKYNCLNCGTEFEHKKNTLNKYCDNKCQQEFQHKEIIGKWKAGGEIGIRPLRKYLHEQNNACWECGITEHNNKPITLEVEHKDGNSTNNSESNLALLCPNCHSQTSTYRNRNKGSGRHIRRQRYADGKSY